MTPEERAEQYARAGYLTVARPLVRAAWLAGYAAAKTATGTTTRAPHPKDRARLSPQCRRILERLKAGPATNAQLAEIARKYTGRISEIRGAGYSVQCCNRDNTTGLCWYRLQAGGQAVLF